MIPGYDIESAIHLSELHAIYRAVRRADGRPVVLKTLAAEYPSRSHVAALRRELQITERLSSVETVIRVHGHEPFGNGNVALVLEPFGRALADRPEARVSVGQALSIGTAVAETLARVHALDVVHKNVQPRSLLLDEHGALRLIDFGIASELSLERQNDTLSKRLDGSLPYISPEQTGRMNRDLDYRSDFYSLGVTLYELLTGELPFHGSSILEWVHAHISKPPRAPHELVPTVPRAVSDIVLKLLAKNAEDRYQSSFGLVTDLSRCLRELRDRGAIEPFALARRDVSPRFHVPQALYGRDQELGALTELFEQVAGGSAEICMVSGYSGIGKSALVNELSRPLVRRSGYLIQGKFDQFQRSTPYSAVAAAFRSLTRQLLAESHERTSALRAKVLAAVAPNAQLLIDLVPELELLLGAQPKVAELPPAEAQNRFHIAVLGFLRVVAAEQPIVLFLDDLQFSDASTIHLVRFVASARDLSGLLLLGAYRSNEVDAGHPLRLALDEIGQGRKLHEIELRPLDASSVERLVADALSAEPARSRPLAALLHDKADGNPFFLVEMLKTLEQERAISFAPDLGRWEWDLDAVRRSGLSSNVVDFVVANLRKLPADTQRALQLASCIGDTFDLRTLSIIHERSMDATAEALLPALKRHMLIPLHADYKLAGEAEGARDEALNPSYRFQHDRVQQAAYALIDADRKQAVHLSVGRLIERHATPEERDERLIDIVGHLNEGRRLIADDAERLALARMNLAAGARARRSSAYESALAYLRIGRELLPDDAWRREFDLTMALSSEYQQCAYLTARYEEAEAAIEEMLARSRTKLEKAEVLSVRTRQYATIGKMEASIQSAIMGLSLLGVRFTDDPSRAAIRRELAAVTRNLGGRKISELISAPSMSDPKLLAANRLLMEIFAAAFLSGSGNLFPYLVLKSVNISLAGGNSPESAFSYAAYGMLLCGVLDDPALGYEYGKLAVALSERLGDVALKSRVIYLYAMFVHHWSNHWSTMTSWFKKGIEAGYQSGDLLYLAYSAQDCIIWDPTLDLETAEREHETYLGIVRDCEYQDSLDSGTLALQLQRSFLGRTDGPCSMNDATFDEQRCVEGMKRRRFMTGIANYHIYKAEICYFHGHAAEALSHVREQDRLIASSMSLPQLARFYVVADLTLAASFAGMGAVEQRATKARMRADIRRMRRWADVCPDNFRHLELMMSAELARIEGRDELALRLYEGAMEAARASEFLRDEAMANELCARHLLANGRRKAAEGYLRAARSLYERWGARRKVELMDHEFPQLTARHVAWVGGGPSSEHRVTSAALIDSSSLDMASVMKASQAISSEIVLEQLWSTTMRIMLENAGGQRGCFVVQRGDRLVLEGDSEVGEHAAPRTPSIADDENGELPLSVVYHVMRTNTPVVLHDATQPGPFARDPYLLARRPRSVICIPLVRQGKFEGAIYMENGLAAGAFTEDRIEVIKLLAAQVSISIENAKLYEDQARLIAAQRRFVPSQFLESLDHRDIANVDLGEHVAKQMSVMFADLRGFTPLAERLDAGTVIELLNRFFVGMEEAILEAGGFIDSFAGDEIKALFEASPDASVRAGIGMWRALEAFNVRSQAVGQPELEVGIGVNTGPVVLGTVGGHNRIQCSVIGDTVNLASRIEQLTKVYKARFLVGERTFRGLRAPEAFEMRMVDRVAVKGKNVAVELYEVIDAERPERRAAKLATREALRAAMDAYGVRDFEGALASFERLAETDPEDAVPPLFVDRCRRHLREPPPSDWQGFEKLTTK